MKKSLLLTMGVASIVAIASCSNQVNSSQNPIKSTSDVAETAKMLDTQVAANKSFSYQDYGEVLKTYVNDQGLVDYAALQTNRSQLDQFNQSLGEVNAETYGSWNEAEQIAFLINAYNAFTLQSIIDQEPLKDSIRDISGVWNRRKFILAGEEKTLDNIEHDTIRKNFNEPRIHVALVCAAMSCPLYAMNLFCLKN